MCGRFMVSNPNRIAKELIGTDDGVRLATRYNIAPGHSAPILVRDVEALPTLTTMRWRFVPHCA